MPGDVTFCDRHTGNVIKLDTHTEKPVTMVLLWSENQMSL